MSHVFVSLLAIVAVSTIAPVISYLVPKNLMPESVLLVIGGIIIGPEVLNIAHTGNEIELLRELGLSFLFLLAGYEVDVHGLKGRSGKLAAGAWFLSASLALAVTVVMPNVNAFSSQGFAVALAMTATALGTLIPILRDRGMLESKIGKSIINHGTIGELFPILAMAILLGVRGTALNLLFVAVFLGLAIVIGLIPRRAQAAGEKLIKFIHFGAESTAQTTVRLTVLLLVSLITVASIFELDVVLGAFAAGFIVRQALPQGRRELEEKLDGIGYGFLIPIFFVTTGIHLELGGIIENPKAAMVFVGLLMVVRGTPVFLAAFLELDTKFFTRIRQSLRIATYCATSLPMIVAVTQVAEDSGVMEPSTASTLVVAGAASVLIMPLLGSMLDSKKDAEKSDDTKVRAAEQKAHEAREAVETTRKLLHQAALAQLEANEVDPESLDEETKATALKQRQELAAMMTHAQIATEKLAHRAARMFPGSDWEEIAHRVNEDRVAVVEHLHERLEAEAHGELDEKDVITGPLAAKALLKELDLQEKLPESFPQLPAGADAVTDPNSVPDMPSESEEEK
ncbi:hypothetical protein BK816_07480 [Boudabousia tangfeifanii]|uniref:Cation/H+ exchanger transmembrane domain-containing protein n=1 Tax=Boudabousia tangfeifanii TaxID=1912795 RepID=A0A1D9MLH4_9ACTO|nr:cation:proton antiporter [Boudabousia tangfeifanii]AOZ73152.1 hypothetical protein BK816_07480 [Boudabousia tangfeifanii]